MSGLRPGDWVVLCAALAAIFIYGLWRSRRCSNVNHYVLAGREMKWYVIGLSMMATQASAVTFISTTGQSYVDGMRFVQFYFGLPLAMIILSFTAVPFFYRAKVFTAYEYLQKRFDTKTETLVSIIFLIQRGLALGIGLYAPAVVLSVILGWPDWLTTVIMGIVAIVLTLNGGAEATSHTHSLQMLVALLGLVAALICAVTFLPSHVSFGDALRLAHESGKLNVITTKFDWNDRYNLWSGVFGGMFLALAYFGTDQSQVQRYLTGRSIPQIRRGLMLNGIAKVPMQMFILFIGAMVFVFYIYNRPPIDFDETNAAQLRSPAVRASLAEATKQYDLAFAERKQAADGLLDARRLNSPDALTASRRAYAQAQQRFQTAKTDGVRLIASATGRETNDTNYIFLTFVTKVMPVGLVGLILAMILGATISSFTSEMNSLSAVSVVDIYKRHFRPAASERHCLFVSRGATVFWAAFAVLAAQFIKQIGSLVEAVNLVGSFFYGGMLGVFVLAFAFPRVRGRGAFWGVLSGEAVIFGCWYFTHIAYLWYNVIGCIVVVITGLTITMFDPKGSSEEPEAVSQAR